MEQKQVKAGMDSQDLNIQQITVIGQGVMGPDIALSMALAGYLVTCVDIQQKALDLAAKKIDLNCRQMIEGGILTKGAAQEALGRINRTLEWDASVAGADFIMEAIPEDMDQKQAVFLKCENLCSPKAIIASNTSSMSITQIAENMVHPQRAITAHWTIPAHLSPLVEVVAGELTSPETQASAFGLLKKMGKHPVPCKDTPGFIHNFLQFALCKAALELVENKVASPSDVDGIVRNGFGLRLANVGPMQFLDMIGLDTAYNVSKYLYETTKNPTYTPDKTIERKVSQGDLGVKTGKGFYEYKTGGTAEFWEKTNTGIIKVLKALSPVSPAQK